MTTNRASTIAITLVLLMAPAAITQTQQSRTADYDAVRDFTIASNPNQAWSYGWEATLGDPLNLYTASETDCREGFSAWRIQDGCGYVPLVGHNDVGKEVCDEQNQLCLPPGYIYLHPGPTGNLSVVRWTAPVTGRFLICGSFVGLDMDNGGTDVHVLVNSKRSLLSGSVDRYKWPLTFQFTMWFSAGDTLDFAVGYGLDRSYNDDSTGVQFKLVRLGR